MDRELFTVWIDDTLQEAIERIKLALIEIGIKLRKINSDADCYTYELTKAEPLDKKS